MYKTETTVTEGIFKRSVRRGEKHKKIYDDTLCPLGSRPEIILSCKLMEEPVILLERAFLPWGRNLRRGTEPVARGQLLPLLPRYRCVCPPG